MVNQKLVNYLEENTKKGYALEQLKTTLLENGYNALDIEEATNYVKTSQNKESSPNKIAHVAEKAVKSTDLKIAIGLTALWGVLSFINIPALSNPASQTDFIVACVSIIIGIFLLISAYGLWTIKKWGFGLSMLSLVILIIINLFGKVYFGALIDVVILYIIYKNKELYQ